MTVLEIGLLLLAGIGAGAVGSTAGLASLVSYPALLLAGLTPLAANVTNTVALLGSSIGAVAGSRRELVGMGPAIRRRLPMAVVAGGLGAWLILISPPGSFAVVVPYLVAGASVLLLLSPKIRGITARRTRHENPDGGFGLTIALFPTFVYGGYFGAAAGVMVLALLLAGTDRSLPVSNAVKNVLLGGANAVAAITFSITADVYWPAVPPMLVGCLIGGWIGPELVRRVPPALLRWLIAIGGFALAVRLWIG